MARTLTFSLDGTEYAAAPVKVERRKLYGWTETIALDDDGRPCKVVSMDETGTYIIPKGGLGLGILSEDMKWVDRSSLKAVTLDGKDAPLLKSSFDGPVVLGETAAAGDILDHSITAIYQLNAGPELAAVVGDKIYTFIYNYRDGYEGSHAFVLANEGSLFMLIGFKTSFEMLSLAETGAIDEDEAEEEEDESGEIDFSMGL
jgi:hypothetical protein